MGVPHFFCYMDTKKVQKAAEELIRPIVEDLGYELVDLRILADSGRTILRIMADRPGGITLDECASLSRELSPHLDVADVVPYAYNLEVSSPGMRRPIKRAADVSRFSGQKVYIATERPIDGRKRFRGVLGTIDEKERVAVDCEGAVFQIPWGNVAEMRLDPDLPFSNVGDKKQTPKKGHRK